MLLKENAKDFIIKKSPSGSTYKTYIFECTKCKKDIKAQSSHLKTHSGKCNQCSQRGRSYEHILNELQKTCIKKNRIFDLNYEDFLKLIEDKECHYCSKTLIYNPYTRNDNTEYVSRAYQLDRKNNNLGYIKNNLVACCWECNRLKSDIYTYEEFMKFSPILKQIQKEREIK